MKRSHSDADLSHEDTGITYTWLDFDKPCFGFTPETKEALLSSSTVNAKYVMLFTLNFVFIWHPHDWHYLTTDRSVNLDNRVALTKFVTEWLAMGNKIPSLKTVCAQRIAMEIFGRFVADIDCNFEERKIDYFHTTLMENIASELSKLDVPVFLHPFVVEEICIFAIVYLLYIDIRKLPVEPTGRGMLQIPIPREIEDDDCWWRNTGMDLVESVVKNCGRGALAKAGLFPYSTFIQVKEHGTDWSMNLIDRMFHYHNHLQIQHPMAESVALIPIVSTCEAFLIRNDYFEEDYDYVFRDSVVPWLTSSMEIKPTHKERDMMYDSMIRVSNFTRSSDDVPALAPFTLDKIRGREIVQRCIDTENIITEYGLPPKKSKYHDYPDNIEVYKESIIKRIRLCGDFTKFEILETAMRFNGNQPTLLDFEGSANLDEECLQLVLNWLYPPKTVRLKGTSINETCELLTNINKNRGDKHKIMFVFNPKAMSREEKLEIENKRLLKEIELLKRQNEELKNKIQI
eukprot:scaffold642_cov75-Cyclotella_meneghiniana.AAC.1